MDIALFLTFLVVSFGLIIIPGPNVLVIVSISMSYGKKCGLQTVAGTSLAMAVQLLIVGLGTAWFVQWVTDGLHYLKWLGVVYLLYLGLRHLKSLAASTPVKSDLRPTASFTRGFMVSLTNPKTLLFFSAFLPQFVSSTGSYHEQIGVLSATFLVMAMVLDSCYALLSSKLAGLLRKDSLAKWQHGFSGLLYFGAGAWLAALKRSA